MLEWILICQATIFVETIDRDFNSNVGSADDLDLLHTVNVGEIVELREEAGDRIWEFGGIQWSFEVGEVHDIWNENRNAVLRQGLFLFPIYSQ